ncbi:MAG: alpha-L-arabinofuranosidase, partial [Verrucomicrobia bacterium]|nr:alpha-L-arabinofuranosidase [Verrucomicrobiota bacterium]
MKTKNKQSAIQTMRALMAQVPTVFQAGGIEHHGFRYHLRLFLCILAIASSVKAQSDLPIYTDSLVNSWENGSWADVNLNNINPVHSGTASASVAADAWEAIFLRHNFMDTRAYSDFVFWINGGQTGGQLLQVQALLYGDIQPAVTLPALAPNTWQQFSIPLASLGVADKPDLDGIWIQDRSGQTKPPFYVDDIKLKAKPAPALVHVDVDASSVIRTIDSRHFGTNAVIWDTAFDTGTTISLLTELDNKVLRFPGGSLSDEYHWKNNTTLNNNWQWPLSFDKFTHVVTTTGAQAFITVNYGTGTPSEAADWVRYANITRSLGIKYWEIGNEIYGSWETDNQSRPHDPYTYALRFKDYFTQMKLIDPTIKVGAVIINGEDSYANYTDHPATNPSTNQQHNGWTPVMLKTLSNLHITPDFVVYHHYPQSPGTENDAILLQASSSWSVDAADLRAQLNDYLGATAASGVELICTEHNSVFTTPGKQSTSLVNGLFYADSLCALMHTEFNALVGWNLRNSQDTD